MNTTRPQVVARVALTRSEMNIILTALTLYQAGALTVGEVEAATIHRPQNQRRSRRHGGAVMALILNGELEIKFDEEIYIVGATGASFDLSAFLRDHNGRTVNIEIEVIDE